MQQGKTATTQRINNAIHTLPRDQFVEMKDPNLVLGRSIPPTQAVLDILRHADIEPRHNVLQVGTGAGYLSALLSKLASQVVTIEINPAIARATCFLTALTEMPKVSAILSCPRFSSR